MNPSYEDFVDQTFSKRYRQLELDIMRDIVRRIKKTSEITSSADWQIMRLTIMGNSAAEIRNMIKEAGELSENDMQKLFDDVIEKEYTRSADLYKEVGANFVPYAQNTEMQQLTQALITQSNNELKSITGTMGFMLDYGDGQGLRFTPHTEIFDDYLNSAVMGIASGAFDYNTMIRRVVTQMTNSGLRTVDYASGRHDRVDVAARRAVLTGLSQLTGRITDTNAAALNTDHFEVAWHAGARPTHQEWQGRVWSKKELVEVCGLGSVTGLLGANCYHDYYPFIPGVSERMYSDEWLDQMNREENTPKIFMGKEYTAYEARQHQRYIERCMRAQREKVELLKEGGADKDEVMLARCKYQAQLDEYKRFSKAMKLPEQRERIYYDMKGRVAPPRDVYQQYLAEQAEKRRRIQTEADKHKERAEEARREDMEGRNAQYLVQSHNPGDNITKERMSIIKAVSKCPQKVQDEINNGTQIIVGKYSSSGYDYKNNILYIAKGAAPEEVAHEIGHLVDNKIVDQSARDSLLRKIAADITLDNVKQDVFVDASGAEYDVIYLKSNKFVSNYQGRVYVEDSADIFDDDGNVRIDKMQEFVSEAFREYWKDSDNLSKKYPEQYSLIDGAVK